MFVSAKSQEIVIAAPDQFPYQQTLHDCLSGIRAIGV
jgi:hypothetical protein